MTTESTPANVRFNDGLGIANEVQPLIERLRLTLPDTPYHRDALHREAADEIERLRAGHDRYEVVLRMSVDEFRDAYVLSRRTGKPFDEIVADLAPFFGLRVRA